MVTVAVGTLQDQLSLYIQYVKNGEKVVITEHNDNEPIAELSVPKKLAVVNNFDQKLAQLSKEGKIILAKKNTKVLVKPKIKENLDYVSILNDVRSDRI
jgi:antitoxin (DNA-binding transcriptional repressor) of toxin-antitoxin stability system